VDSRQVAYSTVNTPVCRLGYTLSAHSITDHRYTRCSGTAWIFVLVNMLDREGSAEHHFQVATRTRPGIPSNGRLIPGAMGRQLHRPRPSFSLTLRLASTTAERSRAMSLVTSLGSLAPPNASVSAQVPRGCWMASVSTRMSSSTPSSARSKCSASRRARMSWPSG
jgi:hypothetical protein